MCASRIGRRVTRTHHVTEADTARQLGNEGVAVLGTAVLCHWFEEVAFDCVKTDLAPGEITVSTRLAFEHLAPSPVGSSVVVEAILTRQEGRTLSYRVQARDDAEVVATGRHERVIVRPSRTPPHAKRTSPATQRGVGVRFAVASLDDRPDLAAAHAQLDANGPKFYAGDPIRRRYWQCLVTRFPDWQFVVTNSDSEVAASVSAAPIDWDGREDTLPAGWDGTLEQAFTQRSETPTAVGILAVAVDAAWRGRGLAGVTLGLLRTAAAARGLKWLITPVRPASKAAYPLIAFDDFLRWRNDRGEAFDPWLRVHQHAGGSLAGIEPRSIVVSGRVGEWQAWTGMRFPASGPYVVPDALSTVNIDLDRDLGVYEEPSAWVVHDL